MIGRTLSHYKIIEEISRGGMGVVYRAVDVKLNREVALKVLPPELVADPDRKRRFVQEAQSAAALHHPHIAVIHEIDEVDEVTFIAMELVEGEPLSNTLKRGKLPLAQVLRLATEVADALARAHDKGIAHRDLKPANIMVTEDGHAKIIDFGLAKLVEPVKGDASEAATAVQEETEAGKVMGTVSYMSPEQARGQKVDHRTDIFSFGIVLHELLSGSNPFSRDNLLDTWSAIAKESAPRLPTGDVPGALQPILDRALAKAPAERYQSIEDMGRELQDLRSNVESVSMLVRPQRLPSRWGKAALVAATVIAVFVGIYLVSRDPSPPGIGESGRPAVAVMYFENLSGDEEIRWLSKGVPSMLLTDLAQTPGLDVVSSVRLNEILGELGQENVDVIDQSLVAEIARRAGAGAVVVGSIFKSGSDIRIDVKVEDVGSGRILSAASAQGSDVFPLVDQLADGIRASLKVAEAAAARPIAEVTTSSLEAYRYYSEGFEAFGSLEWNKAWPLFEKATEIDPSFAMAYFYMSQMARTQGQFALSDEYRRKVLDNAHRLPERHRLMVQALAFWLWDADPKPEEAARLFEKLLAQYPDEEYAYSRLHRIYEYELGQLDKAIDTLERGLAAIPRSRYLRGQYARLLMDVGRYEDGVREMETRIQLTPESAGPYNGLAVFYLVMGRPDEALIRFDRALELDPEFFAPHLNAAWAHGIAGRYELALTELVAAGELTAGTRVDTFSRISSGVILSRLGRYPEADRRLLQAIDQATSFGQEQDQAEAHQFRALLALEQGDYTEALERALHSQPLAERISPPNLGQSFQLVSHLLAGRAQLGSGDLEAAREHLAAQAQVSDPSGVDPRHRWFHQSLEGEIALAAEDLDAAEAAFLAAEPESKSFFMMTQFSLSVFLNNVGTDGLARVKRARGDLQGAIEIYRSLNTPGLENKYTALFEPRYVLESARLLDLIGDKDAARGEYRRFLDFWKDADPDLPEVQEAKAYLAR